MKTLKITPGEWWFNGVTIRSTESGPVAFCATVYENDQVEVREKGESWLDMRKRTQPIRDASLAEAEANAQLIAEAGTVANETGLTPRQLLEQRNELLEVLQEADTYFTKLTRGGKLAKRVSNQIDQVVQKYTL